MPREDSLSSRFDYLFEPVDVDESVDDAAIRKRPVRGGSHRAEPVPSAKPVRMALAALVLGALGAAAVLAVLMLQEPNQPGNSDNIPVETRQLPTTAANVPTQTATPAPPPPTAQDTEAPQTAESGPTQQQSVPESQAPQPTRTSAPRAPEGGASNTPATRAPISVAPESRAPFPNQGPRTGDNGGGLLGGLL